MHGSIGLSFGLIYDLGVGVHRYAWLHIELLLDAKLKVSINTYQALRYQHYSETKNSGILRRKGQQRKIRNKKEKEDIREKRPEGTGNEVADLVPLNFMLPRRGSIYVSSAFASPALTWKYSQTMKPVSTIPASEEAPESAIDGNKGF